MAMESRARQSIVWNRRRETDQLRKKKRKKPMKMANIRIRYNEKKNRSALHSRYIHISTTIYRFFFIYLPAWIHVDRFGSKTTVRCTKTATKAAVKKKQHVAN